jgi:undecaprenyl-diphosphatase
MDYILQTLIEFDQKLLLALNGLHSPFFDCFMSLFTGKFIWIPMYISIVYVLFRNYNWRTVLMCLVAVALTITFADQVCASLIRPIVERPRPSADGSPIADLVHIVNGRRGGSYGFPSCHASNSFGLAMFLILLLRNRAMSWFICCWAFLNCYTRIYLGLHYPGDILVGMLIGDFGAVMIFCALKYLLEKRGQELKPASHTNVVIAVGTLTVAYIIVSSLLMA